MHNELQKWRISVLSIYTYNGQLENLGGLKLNIWKSFDRFSIAFEKIKNKPEFTDNLNEKIAFSKTELEQIKKIRRL